MWWEGGFKPIDYKSTDLWSKLYFCFQEETDESVKQFQEEDDETVDHFVHLYNVGVFKLQIFICYFDTSLQLGVSC